MKNRIFSLSVFSLLAACFLYACAGSPNYGALGPQTDETGQVTVADLENSWEDYDVYYNTWYTATPAALMFDPRDNLTTLTGGSWSRVEDQTTLSEIIESITRKYNPKRVLVIVGPDKQFIGYMITPTTNLFIKVVDEKTFFVSNLRIPPSGP